MVSKSKLSIKPVPSKVHFWEACRRKQQLIQNLLTWKLFCLRRRTCVGWRHVCFGENTVFTLNKAHETVILVVGVSSHQLGPRTQNVGEESVLYSVWVMMVLVQWTERGQNLEESPTTCRQRHSGWLLRDWSTNPHQVTAATLLFSPWHFHDQQRSRWLSITVEKLFLVIVSFVFCFARGESFFCVLFCRATAWDLSFTQNNIRTNLRFVLLNPAWTKHSLKPVEGRCCSL